MIHRVCLRVGEHVCHVGFFFKQTMISPIVLQGNVGVLAIYANHPVEILCINIKL